MNCFKISANQVEYEFSAECGGFPSRITASEFGGRKTVLSACRTSPISLAAGGQLCRPECGKPTPVLKYRRDGARIVEFPRIPWRNASGEIRDGLYLSLKWEFHPDGAVFCDLFLFYATLEVPEIRDFKINIPLDFSDYDDVRWAVRKHPPKLDATQIQSAPPERFLPYAESRVFPEELFVDAGFNAMRRNAPSFYTEFFIEGNNTLFNEDIREVSSSVKRTPSGFELEWNFQKVPRAGKSRPLHWRNRLGFLMRPAPVKRVHPPCSLYQYIDNFRRFPDREQIEALAEAGAQVLVMHDCWRLDTQNGGIPYDLKRFREMRRLLKQKGIRLVLYVRGNEISVIEDAAEWFDTRLTKDFDGLYMDYGGPAGYLCPPDENFIGGRTAFRHYYRCMKSLRERVGKKGLFFCHTGPLYSGIATGFFDGYTSGEGERGILIRGRREHEYFSMSAVSPGTMWTAAFPEYGSPRMTPFLAAAAQAPHLPIGKQIESSSLRHPPVPGISDGAFRGLLAVWRLLGDRTGYSCYTDFNSEGLFGAPKDPEEAHCAILSPDGRCGVCLVSNCSGKKMETAFRPTGLLAKYRLYPIPGFANPRELKSLDAWQVAAGILAKDAGTARELLRKHPMREMPECAAASDYRAFLGRQAACRDLPAGKWKLRVFMPSRITSHEQSLWDDLYNIDLTLRVRKKDGSLQTLGFVTKNGLRKKAPAENEKLRPGDRSPEIDLGKAAGPGKHRFELYSEHLGEPFYSFVTAELSDGKNRFSVEFMNELEPDRAVLHWNSTTGCEK
ncbi:MAG: hypothetical protein BWY31_03957 [Lentisphaerae bacterium ADurb.Bin242]|nr:MAG: hypothetical protein BWY31_03957 [Lentisphaerae bacterium ADurb.Bin242]